MRIGIDATLLVTPHLRAGIYVYVRSLIEGFQRIGMQKSIFLFLANYPKPPDAKLLAELKASFQGFSLKVFDMPKWAYNLRMRFSAYSRMEVFHYPCDSLLWENVSRRANVFTVPDLTFIHFPQHHQEVVKSAWSKFCNRAIQHGDMILTYSEHAKQDIAQTLGVPEERICAAPLAAGPEFVPISDRDFVRQQLALFGLQDQRYILSVGTLEPRKNQARLVRAFGRLLRLEPSLPHQLVLAGGKGWYYEPIFETVTKEGLQDRVLFLGRSDPLEVLYNGADLMVYPSLYEGFGLPPLEAMACGTPVIASNRSSLPEVVGDAALTVEPEDEDAICESMRRLLLDDKLKSEMSAKGIERSRQFSWERTASATLEAYRKAHRMKN